jgi:hypothetical protein
MNWTDPDDDQPLYRGRTRDACLEKEAERASWKRDYLNRRAVGMRRKYKTPACPPRDDPAPLTIPNPH